MAISKMNRWALFYLIALLWHSVPAGAQEMEAPVELAISEEKIAAYSVSRNRWVPLPLGVSEHILRSDASPYVAVAFTTERVLGFSAVTGNWAALDLQLDEVLYGIEATGYAGTVTTSQRALGFSAQTGRWTETALERE